MMAEITRHDLADFSRELDASEATHLDRVAARNAFIEDGGDPDEILVVERLFGLA